MILVSMRSPGLSCGKISDATSSVWIQSFRCEQVGAWFSGTCNDAFDFDIWCLHFLFMCSLVRAWIALILDNHQTAPNLSPCAPAPYYCRRQKCFGEIASWDQHEINHCSRGKILGNLLSEQLVDTEMNYIRGTEVWFLPVPAGPDLRLGTQKHDTSKAGLWNKGQGYPRHLPNCHFKVD